MASADLVVGYHKLDTVFFSGHVQHTTYRSDPSRGRRRVEVVEKWYRDRELGHGSFGRVYLERSEKGDHRAVKEITKRDTRIKIDYKREVMAMATLAKHDALFVQLFGWYESGDYVYIAMEYVRRGCLRDYLAVERSESEAKVITRQLLEGLVIIHQEGFAHRDLKPENILVVSESPVWVKIADFGLAKLARDGTVLRTAAFALGYSAPEMGGLTASDDSSEYTRAVDIWALGCIVHEILTQVVPFPNLLKLNSYCSRPEFPREIMLSKSISLKGIEAVENMLALPPEERIEAKEALGLGWLRLEGEIVDVKDKSAADDPLPGHRLQRGSLSGRNIIEEEMPTMAEHSDVLESHGQIERGVKPKDTSVKGAGDNTGTAVTSRLQIKPPLPPHTSILSRTRLPLPPHILARLRPVPLALTRLRPIPPPLQVLPQQFPKPPPPHEPPTPLRTSVGVGAEEASADGKENLPRGPIRHHPVVSAEVNAVLEGLLQYMRTCQGDKTIPRCQKFAVRMLLDEGISSDFQESGGNTPLHFLAFRRHLIWSDDVLLTDDDFCLTLRTLVDLGVAIDTKNVRGTTALLAATIAGWSSGVKMLLDFGADIDEPNIKGHRPLLMAIERNYESLVSMLLEHGAYTGTARVEDMSYTALHLAAECGTRSMVSDILRKGADVNARNSWGQTPLHSATIEGNLEIAELLIQSGADVEARDRAGSTALSPLGPKKEMSRPLTQAAKPLYNHGYPDVQNGQFVVRGSAAAEVVGAFNHPPPRVTQGKEEPGSASRETGGARVK